MTGQRPEKGSIRNAIRGGFGTLVVIYIADALFFAQGGITFMVALVMIIFGAIDVLRGVSWDRQRLRQGAITIAAYLALDAAVFGTIFANNALAHHRAEGLAAVLDQYKHDHGRYPGHLDDLVPAYIPSVPVAKYTLMPLFNRFDYLVHDGDHASIGYTALPPFGRPFYRLDRREWGYLD